MACGLDYVCCCCCPRMGPCWCWNPVRNGSPTWLTLSLSVEMESILRITRLIATVSKLWECVYYILSVAPPPCCHSDWIWLTSLFLDEIKMSEMLLNVGGHIPSLSAHPFVLTESAMNNSQSNQLFLTLSPWCVICQPQPPAVWMNCVSFFPVYLHWLLVDRYFVTCLHQIGYIDFIPTLSPPPTLCLKSPVFICLFVFVPSLPIVCGGWPPCVQSEFDGFPAGNGLFPFLCVLVFDNEWWWCWLSGPLSSLLLFLSSWFDSHTHTLRNVTVVVPYPY